MRIVKEHDERRNEIIDTAARLFGEKGYEKCSVNDILNAIGIAKGTFYHYFKSKEEVLDAVIDRTTEMIVERVRMVAENVALAPEDKLLQVFMSMKVENQMEEALLEEMHKSENALMHQKSLVSSVKALVPILTEVVEEGIRKGEFVCEYPSEYMQIFMTSAVTLMDDGIFQIEPERKRMLLVALISNLETMLGVPAGKFTSRAQEYMS